MFYAYLTQVGEKYGFGVASDLLYKKLPTGLCYFEIFAKKSEAKHRLECLKKLSYKKLSSLIKSKKINYFF